MKRIKILVIDDDESLRTVLKQVLIADGYQVTPAASGEEALAYCLAVGEANVALMDVQLAGELNGIQTAIAIRREFPRFPVVFYSIQDDEAFYRDFRRSGIFSHYAYVRKSNYLLPTMVVPLLLDAVAGRSFVDPDIAARVQEVRHKDENNPLAWLEPNERQVIRLLAQGMTNEQIAKLLGLRDARAVSRTNGQIYAAWHLSDTTTDEKVARTRAALIFNAKQMIVWDQDGQARVQNPRGEWVPLAMDDD